MKISEAKHTELYAAIYEPIMRLRMDLVMDKAPDMDNRLFKLTGEIYKELIPVLGLTKK